MVAIEAEIGVVDLAETATKIVGPEIAMAAIEAEIGVADLAETATSKIVGMEIVMIAEGMITEGMIAEGMIAEVVVIVMGTEIDGVTMMNMTGVTVNVSKVHGVTTVVEMQEAILIETNESQVREAVLIM